MHLVRSSSSKKNAMSKLVFPSATMYIDNTYYMIIIKHFDDDSDTFFQTLLAHDNLPVTYI